MTRFFVSVSLAFSLTLGCDRSSSNRNQDADIDRYTETDMDQEENTEDPPAVLLASPIIHSPTATSIVVEAVANTGHDRLVIEVRAEESEADWVATSGQLRGEGVVAFRITTLNPSTAYSYRILDRGEELYTGRFVTQRGSGDSFVFALLSDTHVFVNDPNEVAHVLEPIAEAVARDRPDFVIHLGDIVDYHYFGFNQPAPHSSWSKAGLLAYREMAGVLLGSTSHFSVIGNWDGENGCFTDEEIERSRSQRLLYLPNPGPNTYPEGGNENSDYFAFTWGDALLIVLNVMSYTPDAHLLEPVPELAESWTLGQAQLEWLNQTLRSSTSRFKFLCIHHTVGGFGGDVSNSAYGRGGGRAARVGEQALVHELMFKYGVQILFYGHDHVFTDIFVDGIHYALPGSAGAPWKFSSEVTGYETYWPDSGYGRVRVEQESATVEFVSIEGTVLHQFSVE